MKNVYNPERGFFIGKVGNLVKVLVITAAIAYPLSIQADAVLVASSTTSSSTAVAAPMAILKPVLAVKTVTVTPPAAVIMASALSPSSTPTSTAAAENTKLVYITAYASVPDETSDHPFVTASGAHVEDGVVAANFLPFGTKIEIPSLFGNKIFTVLDRTSARFSGRVDIWMPTVSQAVNFGIKRTEVVILGRGSSE